MLQNRRVTFESIIVWPSVKTVGARGMEVRNVRTLESKIDGTCGGVLGRPGRILLHMLGTRKALI